MEVSALQRLVRLYQLSCRSGWGRRTGALAASSVIRSGLLGLLFGLLLIA